MIYFTGDCHSEFSRFGIDKFTIQNEMTKNDYVIICGDFGGVWNYLVESTYEKYWLDWLNERNFTTLFVDGNHENFTRLYNYPVEEWHGGKVHKIRNSVIHLMRGEIFDIDNRKFFTFGGAKSHDIQDGIVNLDEEEKIYTFRKRRAFFRIRDYSWWDLELPTEEEMQNGINNLEKVNYKVDYIITHCLKPHLAPSILTFSAISPTFLTSPCLLHSCKKFLRRISFSLVYQKRFLKYRISFPLVLQEVLLFYFALLPVLVFSYLLQVLLYVLWLLLPLLKIYFLPFTIAPLSLLILKLQNHISF